MESALEKNLPISSFGSLKYHVVIFLKKTFKKKCTKRFFSQKVPAGVLSNFVHKFFYMFEKNIPEEFSIF